MKYLVLFISYFPFNLFLPFLLSGDGVKPLGEKIKEPILQFSTQTQLLPPTENSIQIYAVVETGPLGGEVWIEMCDTAGKKIIDKVYCKKPIPAGRGITVSFACQIVGLHCGTDYKVKLVTQEENSLPNEKFMLASTLPCKSPLSPPKEKKEKKKKK